MNLAQVKVKVRVYPQALGVENHLSRTTVDRDCARSQVSLLGISKQKNMPPNRIKLNSSKGSRPERPNSKEVFLRARVHAQGLETRLREAGKAISNRSVLEEVRDREAAIGTLQR